MISDVQKSQECQYRSWKILSWKFFLQTCFFCLLINMVFILIQHVDNLNNVQLVIYKLHLLLLHLIIVFPVEHHVDSLYHRWIAFTDVIEITEIAFCFSNWSSPCCTRFVFPVEHYFDSLSQRWIADFGVIVITEIAILHMICLFELLSSFCTDELVPFCIFRSAVSFFFVLL